MIPARKVLPLPDLNLSYLEWGQPGHIPVLLLHGLGDHALVWSSLAQQLADQYHLVALDLRGHGDSDKPDRGYTFAEITRDLEGLMDHLGWTQVHGIAHSWSAKLLPIWARTHPQRLRSMVLVDPFFMGKLPRFVNITFPILYRLLPFLQGMGPFPTYTAAQEQARQLNQYQGWSMLQQQVFAAGMEQKADGCWGSKFTVAARNLMFAESVAVNGLTEPLDVPTLLLLPAQGMNRRDWQIRPYRTYLRQLEMGNIPGNHWPFLVAPDAFNPVVDRFLAAKSQL